MHRRDFLRSSLMGAVGALTLGRTAFAQQAAGANLVVVLAYGGWDPMWLFDAKPDAPEVDTPYGDWRSFGNLPVWTDPSRTQVNSFFEQWANQTVFVNGLATNSLAHEECAEVMLTGSSAHPRPDIAARVADVLAPSMAMPYMAIGSHAKTHGFEAQAGHLGYSNQLMSLLDDWKMWPMPNGLGTSLQPEPAQREALNTFLRRRAERVNSAARNLRSQRVATDYSAALERAIALQGHASGGGVLTDDDLFARLDSNWDYIAGAFAEGISQTALVQSGTYWDTHAYNDYQYESFEELFGGLNTLMNSLHERQVLDNTVVLVLSEMGRTPKLNPGQGKDHWSWTSAMAISPMLNGGRVLGQTDAWLRPLPMNLRTGALDDAGVTLHPEHLLHAIARLVGAPTDGWFDREALDALLA